MADMSDRYFMADYRGLQEIASRNAPGGLRLGCERYSVRVKTVCHAKKMKSRKCSLVKHEVFIGKPLL